MRSTILARATDEFQKSQKCDIQNFKRLCVFLSRLDQFITALKFD